MNTKAKLKRITLFAIATLSMAASATLAGCGEGYIALEQMCETSVRAFCEAAARCGEGASSLTICRETLATKFAQECEQRVRMVEDGRLSYDGTEAARCRALSASIKCSELLGEEVMSCMISPFNGLEKEEEPCHYTLKVACMSGLYCEHENSSSGICRRIPGLDEACTVKCKTGLLCHRGSKTCTQPAGLNESCQQVACRTDLYCGGGHCVPRGVVGSRCTTGWIGSSSCTLGLGCARDKTCTPKGDVGQACTSSRTCRWGLSCDMSSNPGKGTCVYHGPGTKGD